VIADGSSTLRRRGAGYVSSNCGKRSGDVMDAPTHGVVALSVLDVAGAFSTGVGLAHEGDVIHTSKSGASDARNVDVVGVGRTGA
jgi:hypothetical protein